MSHAPALICDTDNGGTPLGVPDFAEVPPQVLDDARCIAEREFRQQQAKVHVLLNQMAALYLATKDKDVVVVFNPGGWGWASVSQMPSWATILSGIKGVLEKAEQRVMTLNYLRTNRSFAGLLGEAGALLKLSCAKGQELAARIEHLTRHRPELKVIVAGESNGAAMTEGTVRFLRHNPQVFSIQTGTPFWAPSQPHPRSLIINHNGIEPDSFSSGDVGRWIVANTQALFGRYKGSRGNILLYIGAPGHVYNWEYLAVREQITQFLQQSVLSEIIPNNG